MVVGVVRAECPAVNVSGLAEETGCTVKPTKAVFEPSSAVLRLSRVRRIYRDRQDGFAGRIVEPNAQRTGIVLHKQRVQLAVGQVDAS